MEDGLRTAQDHDSPPLDTGQCSSESPEVTGTDQSRPGPPNQAAPSASHAPLVDPGRLAAVQRLLFTSLEVRPGGRAGEQGAAGLLWRLLRERETSLRSMPQRGPHFFEVHPLVSLSPLSLRSIPWSHSRLSL